MSEIAHGASPRWGVEPGEDAGHDSGSGSLRGVCFLLGLLVIRLTESEPGSRIPKPFRETSQPLRKFRRLTAVVGVPCLVNRHGWKTESMQGFESMCLVPCL